MNRRSALKSGVSSLALLAGISGSVGTVAAKDEGDDGTRPTTGLADDAPLPTVQFGQKLEQLDWGVLPLVADKDVTLSYISAADVPESQRKQVRKNVEDLWERIGITTHTEKQGSGSNKTAVTTYKLQGSVKQANEKLRKLESRGVDTKALGTSGANPVTTVLNAGAKVLAAENGDDVSTQWDPTDSHQIMNYFAGKNLDLDESHCTTLQYAGDNPDDWNYDVTYLPDDWENSLNDPARRWTHARDPVNKLGSAHNWAKDYMQKSQNASDDYDKYRNMGFALHFLADCGNPMHTGSFPLQISYNWIHYTYEASAEKHLMFEEDDTAEVKNYLLNNVKFSMRDDLGPNDYVEVDDSDKFYEFGNKWANHANRLAKISNDYSSEHVLRTYELGEDTDVMNADEDMETQIEYLMKETMTYMMGYVEEYNGDVSY